MKTTHELAKDLLALKDVPVVIEYWVQMEGFDPMVGMSECYDEPTAIIFQDRKSESKGILQ